MLQRRFDFDIHAVGNNRFGCVAKKLQNFVENSELSKAGCCVALEILTCQVELQLQEQGWRMEEKPCVVLWDSDVVGWAVHDHIESSALRQKVLQGVFVQVRAPERDKFFCFNDLTNNEKKRSNSVLLIQWTYPCLSTWFSGTYPVVLVKSAISYLERFKTRLRFAIKFVLNKILFIFFPSVHINITNLSNLKLE